MVQPKMRQPLSTAAYLFSVSSQPLLKKYRGIRDGLVEGPLLGAKPTINEESMDAR
jgi:hypothetical protein